MTATPEPSQLYAFKRRYASPAADALADASVTAALLATDGACWTEHDDERLLERCWWAMAWRYRGAYVYATDPLCRRWLEVALRREPGVMVRSKLAEALAVCRASALSAESFPDTPAGDRALDEALAALPRATHPPAPTRLRWRGGAALSPGAAAWLIDALSRERLKIHTFPLTWIRERLHADDVRALLSERLAAADARISADASAHEAARGMFSGPILYARAILGGPEQALAIAEALEVLASGPDGAKGAACVEALARNGSPVALRQLRALQRGRRVRLGRLAERALERLAERQDLSGFLAEAGAVR